MYLFLALLIVLLRFVASAAISFFNPALLHRFGARQSPDEAC